MTEAMNTTKRSKKPKAPKLFPDELIDQLLAQVQNKDAESILGESGLAGQLKKQLAERMLDAELSHHLVVEAKQGRAGNHRNGSSRKTVITPNGTLDLDIPRDRLASFEPQLVAKCQHRLPGFDDHAISMYARGMSVREIQGHLLEIYGLRVSPDLISTITDEVLTEVEQWQQRPLEAMYPIVYFDALRLKIRDEGTVKNKAVYLALGIRADGRKEVLGLWIEQTEGATAEAAIQALRLFAESDWGQKFPTVVAMLQRQWEHVIPFFAYPPEVRKIIYTTNAIESMHMQLRKIVKNRGHFPSDEAASKLLYLALRNIEKDWKMPPITWKQAVNQFAILFGERFTDALS